MKFGNEKLTKLYATCLIIVTLLSHAAVCIFIILFYTI